MYYEYLPTILFWLIAGLTGLCAIATVVTQNIVRSATWLLFTLAGTSAIFFLLGADFIGGIQLLIYVGGTLILVVFGVMLTAQGPFISMKTSGAEWAISIVAGILLFAVLCIGISARNGTTLPIQPSLAQKYGPTESDAKPQDPSTSHISSTLGQALVGAPYGPAYAETAAQAPLTTHYLLPFEIVSVHLLVVLIGAAYLARAKRPRGDQA